MNKMNSIEFLDNCLNAIKNTSVEDYKKIKVQKKLDFKNAYMEEENEIFSLKKSSGYTMAYKDEKSMYINITSDILISKKNSLDDLSKSA